MTTTPGTPDDTAELAEQALEEDVVADYLRRHPDFLTRNPGLLSALTPPEQQHGDGVVDMQSFMLKTQRADVEKLRARETALLDAAEANAAVQSRIFNAVQKILAARSFEHLISIINDEMPEILVLDTVVLCVESDDTLPGKGKTASVIVLKPGTIDALTEADSDVVLVADHDGNAVLFGDAADQIRSVALLRLKFGSGTPAGLLALGSSEADGFDPAQGTELLSFLARVLERCIRRWLGLTS